MHYSNKEFSKNGADTIQALSDPSMPLGNVNSLSAVDVLQINLLYNCPEALKQGTLLGSQCVQTDYVWFMNTETLLIRSLIGHGNLMVLTGQGNIPWLV